ncbi:hypothetical protein UNSWDHB_2818 [Dehalobacter sp. UNSWDHB]|nr:DUF5986 family protein [Dehalobacter sp. TeCB1]EQB19882.1 hypothetical protein UNSWDHB_2818 [Dehalobacter sp. UNSWDHB]OCZ49930.1 hypothetical protein A7D23_00865 [Dehalobacter sp. TeCB1]
MGQQNDLDRISEQVIQKIYQSLFQAVGEDYQEAESHLELETHISRPFMIWDFINRNLIKSFFQTNVLYSTKKRGMWEVLLLYDKESKMILSFMKDTRFKDVRKAKRGRQPQYVKALLLLNKSLQAKVKQQKLFYITEPECDNDQLNALLDSLCANFMEPVISEIKHHALIVFSSNYDQLTSLNAYMLDSDLDIVSEKDMLNVAKPIMSNEVDKVSKGDVKHKQPKLTEKANRRLKQKELVALKSMQNDKQE